MNRRSIALAALLALSPVAWGQAARTDGTAAEAPMERAKRAAAGPLKAIQQAAKINRRRAGPEAVPVPVVSVIAASAGEPPSAAGGVSVAQAAALAEAPTVEQVLEADTRLPPAADAAEVTAIATGAQMPAAPATLPPTAVLSEPVLDAVPQVLNMVEPSIPSALLALGPQTAEVEAELSLLADGSVAGVTLLPPVPRAWQRHITAALERWRFAPMSGSRLHRVRLVFNAPAER